VILLDLLSVLAVTASTILVLVGLRLALGTHTPERRRLLVSMHVSSFTEGLE